MAEAEQEKRFTAEMRQIIDRLDDFHKTLRNTERRLRHLEARTKSLDLPRVSFAMRGAMTRVTAAGSKLVDTHLILGKILQASATPSKREKEGGAHE